MTFAQPFSGYEILARVGAGSMGTVFRAHQKHMNRIVALKVLKPSLARNEKYVERLRREARIVGQLNHPNIVTGYDLGEEGGYHFFVMEFVEGKSLRGLLQEWGFFPEEKVLDVGIQVAEALDHAFRQGVIHRDVKPGNILIDDEGRVKLTDMGLAKGPSDMTLTRDGATVGTPQFISPEQARDPKSVDIRSDLYSLGATLFQMASGTAPFQAETIGELIHKVLHEPAPDVAEFNPGVDEGLALVIKKLLSKDPALRYQTPAELLEDLRRVERQEEPGVDVRHLERAERRGSGNRGRTLALTFAAILVVGLSLTAWAVSRGSGSDAGDAAQLARVQRSVRELESTLAGARVIRERLEACTAALERAETPAERRAIQAVAARVDRALRDAIDASANQASDPNRIDRWITQPVRWSDTAGYLREVAEQALFDASGYRSESLPQRFRSTWQAVERRVLQVVDGRLAQRDQNYEQAFSTHLEGALERELSDELVGDGFEAARRRLADGVAGFNGREGRPTFAQMGDALRLRVEQAGRSFRDRWTKRIDERERQVATAMRTELNEEIGSVRRAIAEARNPTALLQRLNRFRTESLAGRYPPSAAFSTAENPWPEVESKLSLLERELGDEARAQVAGAVAKRIEFAYRILVDDGVAQARNFLADVAGRYDSPLAQRHLQLAIAAADARDLVLRSIVGSELQSRSVPAGQGSVLVQRQPDGEFTLVNEADKVRLPFAVVCGPLLRHTRDLVLSRVGDDDTLRLGLALWFTVAGETGEVSRVLQDNREALDFFADVSEIVAATPIARFGASGDGVTRLLAKASRARERGDLVGVKYLLKRFDSISEAAVDGTDRDILVELQTWVRDESVRRDRAAQLQLGAPAGVTVEVDEEGLETVRFTAAAAAGLDLHADWVVQSDVLELRAEGLSLEEAWARRLDMPTWVRPGPGASLECEAAVRLGVRSGVPAVYVFGCGVRACALVVLPSGGIVSATFEPGVLRDVVQFRRHLADAIGKGAVAPRAWAVAGVAHVVRIRVLGTSRPKFQVWLDDVALVDERVTEGRGKFERFTLVSMQATAVESVAFRAQQR